MTYVDVMWSVFLVKLSFSLPSFSKQSVTVSGVMDNLYDFLTLTLTSHALSCISSWKTYMFSRIGFYSLTLTLTLTSACNVSIWNLCSVSVGYDFWNERSC